MYMKVCRNLRTTQLQGMDVASYSSECSFIRATNTNSHHQSNSQ